MVALDKQFDHHHGTKPRSCGRWRNKSWQAGKTPGRRTADSLFARRDDKSISSNTSCANEIIYCGYRFDPETQLYYVRNRTYNSALGRWIQRDPIGYKGGINLYGDVEGGPAGAADATGLQVYIGPGSGWPQGSASGVGAYTQELQWQYIQWWQEGNQLSSEMMSGFLSQQFAKTGDNAGLAFEKFAGELKSDPRYRAAAQTHIQQMAIKYGKPGVFLLWPKIPPKGKFFLLKLKATNAQYASNYFFGTPLPQFAGSLGVAHIGYLGGVMIIKGCPGHLHWKV